MHYHSIIIGAGPAGLFAAGELASKHKKVLLLEKNSHAGKKLLISGSGQCNITHKGEIEEFFSRYGDSQKFIQKALKNFDNHQCMTFFKQAGVALEIRENGKVFPKNSKSTEILDALLLRCKKNNVLIKYNQSVTCITNYDQVFTVETADGKTYSSDTVIVATGGMSFPQTGSTGDGYKLAQLFGHTIVEPHPALTYVTTHDKLFSKLSGVALDNIQISIMHQNKLIKKREGRILFTHKGLSGPVILDSTRWIYPGDQLIINFMYPKTFEACREEFSQQIPMLGKETIVNYLIKEHGFIKSFAQLICEQANVEEQKVCARLNKEEREKIVKLLTQQSVAISGLGGLHSAMVTAGGVALKQVNPTTMESRKQPGLYFAGEVLDIDGDTGGYNIQAAFSMGHLCAQSILKKI